MHISTGVCFIITCYSFCLNVGSFGLEAFSDGPDCYCIFLPRGQPCTITHFIWLTLDRRSGYCVCTCHFIMIKLTFSFGYCYVQPSFTLTFNCYSSCLSKTYINKYKLCFFHLFMCYSGSQNNCFSQEMKF